MESIPTKLGTVKEKSKAVVTAVVEKAKGIRHDDEVELLSLEDGQNNNNDEIPKFQSAGFGINVEDLTRSVSLTSTIEDLSQRGGVDALCTDLRSDLREGLKEDDLTERKQVFGINKYSEPPHASWFELFVDALKNLAVIILAVSAVISFLAGIIEAVVLKVTGDEWIEGAAIVVAVLIVAIVTATNDYAKDKQFRKLRRQNSDRNVRVIRNGTEHQISVFDICVGDIVILFTGDKIPADGIFLQDIEELRVDESSLTGEPHRKKKNKEFPFLFSGCNITKGSGKMLVTSVGMNTVWGNTIALIPVEQPPTPLQDKLEDLVILIGKAGLATAVLVFIVLTGHYIYDSLHPTMVVPCTQNMTELFLYENETHLLPCSSGSPVPGQPDYITVPSSWDPVSLIHVLSAFIVAVTIVVVAVPEGLPLAVTISLAYSMRLMAADQNLVRHLSACETMGGVTNICSDKTGTLTENKMTVQCGWFSFGKYFDSVDDFKIGLSPDISKLLAESCCLNNEDGFLDTDEEGQIKYLGNVTECALLLMNRKLGIDSIEMKRRYPVVHKWGFTSDRKRMSTVIKYDDGVYRMYTKGAFEVLIPRCVSSLGNDVVLTEELTNEIRGNVEQMSNLGLRTLCLAYRDFDSLCDWDKDEEGEEFEQKLTFIAIIGIEDPVRPEVPLSVQICQEAGVTVRMVTGDNITTATKIARTCNILTENGIAIEGPNFAKLSDDELKALLPRLQILARSSPADKFRLVTALRDIGEVVAVTGDGTNDAPALSAADVGLAMGIAGTEVAKQAADIIILDDNFASIVKSIMWGRCVFDNVRKFLQFQITVNVAALVIAFIGAITDYGTPLTAVQLLWVNLIMDTLAALALGTEKPTKALLRRKPYGRGGKLITWIMWRNIIGQSLLQIGILVFLLYATDANHNHLVIPRCPSGKDLFDKGLPSVHYTIVFNVFVLCQVFNEINSRKVGNEMNVFKGIFKNPIFTVVLGLVVLIQVLIVQYGGNAVKTVPLAWDHWLICIFVSFLTIPVGFLLRLIKVPLEDWEIEKESVILNES